MPSLNVDITITAVQNDTGSDTALVVVNTVGGLIGGLHPTSSDPPGTGQRYELFSRLLENDRQAPGGLSNIQVSDETGRLSVITDQGRCFLTQNTTGKVEIRYHVIPARGTDPADIRSRVVQGVHGIVAPGSAFLPLLPGDETFDVHVSLGAGSLTSSWHGRSTLGHAGKATSKQLQEAIFMFGDQIKCIPDVPGRVGIYHLGELPDNLNSLARFCEGLFPYLAKHFKDETGSLSLYWRRVPGQAIRSVVLGDAILLDYDDDGAEAEWELIRCMTRCMVARWARLDSEEDGSDSDWFTLGISYLYSIYFPFRFRFQTPDYFRATLNGYLTSYFTNPLIKVPSHDLPAASEAWHGDSAKAMRACLYMIRMDSLTRRASLKMEAGIERPIDEIVADICARQQNGEKVREKDWLKYMGDWIGHQSAEKHLNDMKNGVVLDLEEISSAFGGSLTVERQKVVQMGFDVQSLRAGVVGGVEAGSNAEAAGLRDGDEIRWYMRPQLAEEHYEDKYRMRVARAGQEMEVEWWPRGEEEEEARSWQSRKKPA